MADFAGRRRAGAMVARRERAVLYLAGRSVDGGQHTNGCRARLRQGRRAGRVVRNARGEPGQRVQTAVRGIRRIELPVQHSGGRRSCVAHHDHSELEAARHWRLQVAGTKFPYAKRRSTKLLVCPSRTTTGRSAPTPPRTQHAAGTPVVAAGKSRSTLVVRGTLPVDAVH